MVKTYFTLEMKGMAPLTMLKQGTQMK